ncbi:43199_t:CDS:2 [Gigaspora margarita]|uniref:chitin synthase n=1 Tax=Gigaspora margarita TaxID=4874 RepID=A0ABN7VEF8_GIGMA|nr:43199_t:CDS:2 [Gigaspora margarita]
MLSSLVQYLLLIPSYVNILIIYAFCNTHDVSWGTKGDNINSGVQSTNDDNEIIKIDIIQEDYKGAAYDNIINELKNKKLDEKQHHNAVIRKDDYYRLFRTNFVLSWIFTNVLTFDEKSDKKRLKSNLGLKSAKRSDQKRLRCDNIAKNLDVEFPLGLTSDKKIDQKRKIESEHRQRENEITIIKDIANKLSDLKNIEKNLSKLNVLKNVLKFIEKSDQDMQRILNENEILRKEKNLYLRYIIQIHIYLQYVV